MAYEVSPFPVILLQLDGVRQSTHLPHHYKMPDKMPLLILTQIIYKGPGQSSFGLPSPAEAVQKPSTLFSPHTWRRVDVYKEKPFVTSPLRSVHNFAR